jgi:hypothetical protein
MRSNQIEYSLTIISTQIIIYMFLKIVGVEPGRLEMEAHAAGGMHHIQAS